MIKGKIF